MMIKSKNRVAVVAIGVLTLVALCFQYARFAGLLTGFSGFLEARLRVAACQGDTKKVERLLWLGINVNAIDDEGASPLMLVEACKGDVVTSRVELVELLIAKGADVNLRNSEGRTALMYAARNGDTPALNALLKSGASVNITDNGGETALTKAATSSCNEETVRALLNAGADLQARDRQGRNALDSFRASYACPESKVGSLLQQDAATRKGG